MKNLSILVAILIALLLSTSIVSAQWNARHIAITIDDVPFEGTTSVTFKNAAYTNKLLLGKIRRIKTPVTAFITGCQLTAESDHAKERLAILNQWIASPLVTLGNHSEHHLNHSKTSLDTFMQEVSICDARIRLLAEPYKKQLRYFRFPYNALGMDSADQAAKLNYLESKHYILTPFTVENADYIYNTVYVHELELGHKKRADSIARRYLAFTTETLREIEAVSDQVYARKDDHTYPPPINQILLIHDLPINAEFYEDLIRLLRRRGYSFITLETALKDKVYQWQNYYHGTYGISWVYRWMENAEQRKMALRHSPDPDKQIYNEYEQLQKTTK